MEAMPELVQTAQTETRFRCRVCGFTNVEPVTKAMMRNAVLVWPLGDEWIGPQLVCKRCRRLGARESGLGRAHNRD